MESYDFDKEQEFNLIKHVEKKLGYFGEGDVSIACWEPGQVSPNHCHPDATEIYFCFEGGGIMRTLDQEVEVKKGGLVVHPKGELHEFTNGPERTILFRVRYGEAMTSRTKDWHTNPAWQPNDEDHAYFL
ncbi:cupin domain-containing protein [Alphaproteobacteria bacterium]|nr:cupin domain-containing protein [Alphaproteobacteria bacterium]MDA9815434.1 cupin domain-containing protein [Alphaproteobacteria bacterium]